MHVITYLIKRIINLNPVILLDLNTGSTSRYLGIEFISTVLVCSTLTKQAVFSSRRFEGGDHKSK